MKLAFIGDIYLSGKSSHRHEADRQRDIFTALRARIGSNTLLVGNVEFAITNRESAHPYKWASLCTDPAIAQDLKALTVGCVANNHAGDAGWPGLQDTVAALSQVGVQSVGCGRNIDEALAPCIIERGGTRIALVAMCCLTANSELVATYGQPGVAPVSVDNIEAAIARARAQAQAVIVLAHWGCEQSAYPVPDQIRLGRIAIDAGAAAVIGCHAHVIQTFEEYRDCWIFHGIGNFFFDSVRARSFRRREFVSEFSIDHSDRRNRESLVPVFEASAGSLRLVDLILSRWDQGDYPAPAGGLEDAAASLKAANTYLGRWAALHAWKLRGHDEMQFRCVLRNGTVKYDYANGPIRREWLPSELGTRIYRRANRFFSKDLASVRT